jgi:hypothetical protein
VNDPEQIGKDVTAVAITKEQAVAHLARLGLNEADWSKLSRRSQRDLASELAALIATAPLEIQAAVLVAVSKGRNKARPARKPSKPATSQCAAQQAIIDQYRRERFSVNVSDVVAQFRKRFERPPLDDWQETRKALLIAAFDDLEALLREKLPPSLTRQLVAEKYRSLPLGVSETTGRNVALRVSATTLWKCQKRYLESGSPESLHMDLDLCGRHRTGGALS